MSKRKILLGSLVATAAAAVIGGGLTAIPASASVAPITAYTYSPLHPDTTSVSGSATQTLPDGNGPVWSYDNLHETITAKPESGPGNWNVTIRVGSGSNYHGFADPRTADEHSSDPGGILASQGTVTGTIQYDIQSSNTPNPSAVPQTEADGTGLGTALNQFFGGNYTIAGGGHYLFNYSNVGGATYTQNG